MTQRDGIDLSKSTWENPDGFTPAPRPAVAAPELPKTCDAPGPDGWLCDLQPGHGPDHRADNGQPGGVTWYGEMAETTAIGQKQQTFIPAYREPQNVTYREGGMTFNPEPESTTALLLLKGRVFDVAQDALKAESPAAWVRALDKISEMCRG